jgi:tetratricopeptide (TPR) repeat protein
MAKPRFRGARMFSVGILICATAVATAPARGELTVESLTAGAVSGVGPHMQDIEDAIRDFAAKDYARAMSHLESAKKTTPRLAPAEVMMAHLYFDGQQPSGGITMLEQVIKRQPTDPEAYVMLGERGVAEGRVTEAAAMFEKASGLLEKFSDNPRRKQLLQSRAYAGWAATDEAAGNYAEAQKKLEELLKVEPRSTVAHEKLARVLFKQGDQRRAYAEFQAAAEGNRNAMPAELAMAALTTDKAKSENWVNMAVKQNGKDLRTRLGAADFLLRNNQVEEAKIHADEALKLDPKGLETNLMVGIIARMLGDYKKAETHLETAHLLAPANAAITNHLAMVLIELPDEAEHRRALQFADLNVRQNPNSPELMAALGWVNYRLNRRVEAQRAFTMVLNSPPQPNSSMTNEMGYYMAHLAKERGKVSEAIRILKEALNNNQPFAYRKPAQEMLTELTKMERDPAAKAKAASTAKAASSTAKDKSDKAESVK